MLFLFFFFFVTCGDTQTKVLTADRGELKISPTEFSQETIYSLNGEWDFYWKEIVLPENLHSISKDSKETDPKRQIILLPSDWSKSGYPSKGYASFHLHINLPENQKNLALSLPPIYSASKIYINGSPILELGKFGLNEETSQPEIHKTIILLKDKEEVLDILIQVSNFHHLKAGLLSPILLGNRDTLTRTNNKMIGLDLIQFGALCMIGINYIIFFIFRRDNRATLYFGLLCLFMGMRTLTINDRWILDYFSGLNFLSLVRMEFFFSFLSCYFFILFTSSFFGDLFSERLKNFFSYSFLACIPPIFLFQFERYIYTVYIAEVLIPLAVLYIYYVIYSGIKKRKIGAKYFAIGYFFFSIVVALGILKLIGIINLPFLGNYGLFVFLFFQLLILSKKSAREMISSTKIGKKLKIHKLQLEKEVKERTLDLQNAKKKLESINHFTHLINSLSDLNEIFNRISNYFNENFNIEESWLFIPDERNKFLIPRMGFRKGGISEDQMEKLLSKKLPLNASGGSIVKAFQRKKNLFMNRWKEIKNNTDREIVELLSINSFLIIPLESKNLPTGVLLFLNRDNKLVLSRKEIDEISRLCSQISGVIDTAHLLQQVNRINGEIDYLNHFSKLINASNNLDEIFQFAVEKLKDKVNANIFLLQLIDRKTNELYYRCGSFPEQITDKSIPEYFSRRLPIEEGVGSYFVTISRRKTLYIKDLSKTSPEDFSPFDTKLIQDFHLTSVFQLPLLIRNDVIGIIHINQLGGIETLSKPEIKFIESFCEQLALAVNNSVLFEETEKERQQAEKLLLNILPKDVALELKTKGYAEPVNFESVSVLFTDFKGFTSIAEQLSPKKLVEELDQCFSYFDALMERFNLEKLKTIGDSYMCAGGIPKVNSTHAIDCILAALEIQSMMNQMKEIKESTGTPYWELRLGIHSGPIVAGVIGEKKFAYDVWGDTVNTASRMESSGTPGRINISGSTYNLVKRLFECEHRGKIQAKNKGEIDMYYVNRILPEFSSDERGKKPNADFWKMYANPDSMNFTVS